MRALACGCSGEDVRRLQQLLRYAGYNIEADGVFGGATHAAVVDFQQKHGLDRDGVVGNLTWTALKSATDSEIVAALEDCLAAIERLPEFVRLSGLLEVD